MGLTVTIAAMADGVSTMLLAGAPARDALLASVSQRLRTADFPKVVLATVLVGDDGPSHKYVASKHRTANQVGIQSVHVIIMSKREKYMLPCLSSSYSLVRRRGRRITDFVTSLYTNNYEQYKPLRPSSLGGETLAK